MKTINKTFLAMMMASFLFIPGHGMAKDRPKVAVLIAFDDSGSWQESSKEADQMKVAFIKQLLNLKKRRKTRHAQIDFISTSTGGSELTLEPMLLAENWNAIEPLIKGKPNRCNNLVKAFQTIRSAILEYDQEGMEEIYIYIFSSLINLPAPCDKNNHLFLPQKPPVVDLDQNGTNDLQEILTRSSKVKTVLIYGVKGEQFDGWYELLFPKQWVQKNPENIFRMKIFSKTNLALRDGLFIRR